MNSKLFHCTLVLAVCFVSVTAQAGIFRIKVMQKPIKAGLQRIGKAGNITSQRNTATIRTTIEDWTNKYGSLYGRTSANTIDQLEINIRNSITRAPYMISNQLKQTMSNVYQSADGDGTILSRPIGFRDISVFGQNPDLTHIQRERLVQHFDGLESFHTLSNFLADIISNNSINYGAEFAKIVTDTYAAMARGQIQEWNLEKAIKKPLREFVYKKNLSKEEAPIFFPEGRAKRMPDWLPLSQAISFTEFQVQKNEGKFPTLGLDPDLDVMIMELWNKILELELGSLSSSLLANDYLYSPDLEDIEEIISEAILFFDTYGRWPGVRFFTAHGVEALQFEQRMRAGELTEDDIFEVEMGQKLLLITEGLPYEYFNELSADAKAVILTIGTEIASEHVMRSERRFHL